MSKLFKIHCKLIYVHWTCFCHHTLCLETPVTRCTNMKLTLAPTKTPSLFTKHFYIGHFPFAPCSPSLSLFTSGHFSFCFLFSSSLVALMHSHHPFIHVDVLFIKAGIIQPTPRHLRLLRSTSHSITPPLPPTPTHGVSPEAYTLPAPLPRSLLLSPWRSHSHSYFSALLWNLTVQRMYILYISTQLGCWWS